MLEDFSRDIDAVSDNSFNENTNNSDGTIDLDSVCHEINAGGLHANVARKLEKMWQVMAAPFLPQMRAITIAPFISLFHYVFSSYFI